MELHRYRDTSKTHRGRERYDAGLLVVQVYRIEFLELFAVGWLVAAPAVYVSVESMGRGEDRTRT